MLIQPYQLDELRFAFCYRVYYRWLTHRSKPQRKLRNLSQAALESLLQPYGIHVLEASATDREIRVLVSLSPSESVAVAASKMKGRVSVWLREQLGLQQAEKLLSRGYFACTTGHSTTDAVDQYLDRQGEHHGYADRARPPVFVQRYPLSPADTGRLRTDHAVTLLQIHVVLASWLRRGVFTATAAEAVAKGWRRLDGAWAVEKVSFVPDHVHLAAQLHPGVSPAELVVTLMNDAQQTIWNDFDWLAIEAKALRLWQPSAYVGSYGDLQSAKIASYVRSWEAEAKEERGA